jgi:hypothetical protein
MRMKGRLQRLERAAGVGRDEGCPACRDRRGRIVFATSQMMPDGTTVPQGDWPAPCEACGGVPEFTIEMVRPVVQTREDMDRPAAEGRLPQS